MTIGAVRELICGRTRAIGLSNLQSWIEADRVSMKLLATPKVNEPETKPLMITQRSTGNYL